MKKFKIIISGGGTGGHIFPALAIADSLKNKNKNIEFLFVGAIDRMEMEKIPAAGYNIVGLWISGIQRKISLRNFLFPIKLAYSLYKSKKILKKFMPDLVIGTGGYASGPLIYVASKKGIPAIIQEQNSYPGITNKILARYVDKICVAYDKMEKYFPKEKIIEAGNPVRKDILNIKQKRKLGNKLFSINLSKKTVLVIGGSLGAYSINQAIYKNINEIKSLEINLIWQTGSSYSYTNTGFVNAEKDIKQYTFIKEMDLAYASADIIISRAGAIAISELCCIGKPVILVPSPNVAENHQYKNAQSLVNKNAALVVDDSDASRKLVVVLRELINNEGLQKLLSNNIKKIAVNDAADKISDIALDLII